MKISEGNTSNLTPFDEIEVGGIFATEFGNVYVKGEATSEKLATLSGEEYIHRTRENDYFEGKSFQVFPNAELVLNG